MYSMSLWSTKKRNISVYTVNLHLHIFPSILTMNILCFYTNNTLHLPHFLTTVAFHYPHFLQHNWPFSLPKSIECSKAKQLMSSISWIVLFHFIKFNVWWYCLLQCVVLSSMSISSSYLEGPETEMIQIWKHDRANPLRLCLINQYTCVTSPARV